jgi:hypothetical protein
MEKIQFLEKTKEIISNINDENHLEKDWDTDSMKIEFKDKNGKNCEIRIYSRFFGLFKGISFWINLYHITEYKLTRKEYRQLSKAFNDKKKEIKNAKLNNFFKDEYRDNQIEQILN